MWGVLDMDEVLLVMLCMLNEGKFIVCFCICILGNICDNLLSFMMFVCLRNLLEIMFMVIGIFIIDCFCICVVIVIFLMYFCLFCIFCV